LCLSLIVLWLYTVAVSSLGLCVSWIPLRDAFVDVAFEKQRVSWSER
jgi:hypothetical protein